MDAFASEKQQALQDATCCLVIQQVLRIHHHRGFHAIFPGYFPRAGFAGAPGAVTW
jgi:hypothetical protein